MGLVSAAILATTKASHHMTTRPPPTSLALPAQASATHVHLASVGDWVSPPLLQGRDGVLWYGDPDLIPPR